MTCPNCGLHPEAAHRAQVREWRIDRGVQHVWTMSLPDGARWTFMDVVEYHPDVPETLTPPQTFIERACWRFARIYVESLERRLGLAA